MAAVGYLTPGGGEGIPGPKGDQGDPGPQGPPGDTGPAGPKGDTGPAGADGAQGPKGDTGSQGPKGDTGATGPAGADGAQGIQGVKGDTGAQGIQGVKGDTGSQGPAGPAGAVFPLEEGYGFHSASVHPDTCVVSPDEIGGSWQCLVWVPAGKPITKAGTIVGTAASGSSAFNGFAVYDTAGTKLGDTGNVAALFTSAGIRSAPLTAPVAAQGSGRFVIVVIAENHATPPMLIKNVGASGRPELNNTAVGARSRATAALTSFPATISPTGGTTAVTSQFCLMLG